MPTYRATLDFDILIEADNKELAEEIADQRFVEWLRDGCDSLIIEEVKANR